MDIWLTDLLSEHKNSADELITILQKVQAKIGYIPEETVHLISKSLNITGNRIFGVASFYSQFRFTKPPKHSIKVCHGTACHVRGGQKLTESLENELKISCGSTTPDGEFGLEQIACFGCCALAPVVVIDEKAYGRMTPQKSVKEIKKIKENK